METLKENGDEPWTVSLIDTGESVMTGGRLKRVAEYVGDDTFCCTYGDCVGDVDITGLVAFHREEGGLATLTAVQPPGRFGAIALGHDETTITHFKEKPAGDGGWINGGFFVLEPEVIDYIEGDSTALRGSAARAACRRGKARCIPASRVLAEHGYDPRQDGARSRVGGRLAGLEGVVRGRI